MLSPFLQTVTTHSLASIDPLKLGSNVISLLQNSVFTLCLPGDLTFQKRFFDAIISGCIPVVVKRSSANTQTYFDERITSGRKQTQNKMFMWDLQPNEMSDISVSASYPAVGVPYSSFVLELTPDTLEKGTFLNVLAEVPASTIIEKQRVLRSVRHFFVYDLSGRTQDAFSSFLHQVQLGIQAGVPCPAGQHTDCQISES